MRWTTERSEQLRSMWAAGERTVAIADALGSSRGGVYLKARELGLPSRPRGRQPGANALNLPARDPSRQRRFIGVSESDGPRVDVKPWHPAARNGGTIFGQTVTPAAMADRVLKSGEHNRKIGKMATKGRWKGMPIYTLTLEERATCPRSCLEWLTCYGNNMGRAPRIHDDGFLTLRLAAELAHYSAVHEAGFIVRLHVLGDFFSVEYVHFWRRMLHKFANLRIFGFTARLPSTEIGREVLYLIRDFEDQALFRVSGGNQPLLCSEVVETAELATGVVCPAQLDPERCCATCGLCWQTDRTISFIQH